MSTPGGASLDSTEHLLRQNLTTRMEAHLAHRPIHLTQGERQYHSGSQLAWLFSDVYDPEKMYGVFMYICNQP